MDPSTPRLQGGVPDDAEHLPEDYDAAHVQVPLVPPTGGDFQAVTPLENCPDQVAVVVGDVSGHGPKAAAHAQRLRDALVGCLEQGLPPEDALGFVNAAAEMDPGFDTFATVFVGTVESDTGRIRYASGGHEPGLVSSPKNEAGVEELESTGPPLGVLGADEVRYEQKTTILAEGGTLLLYTDGVIEARRGVAFFGIERLRKLLCRFASLPPARLVRKLLGRVRAFAGTLPLRDDTTLVALRRRLAPRGWRLFSGEASSHE